MSNKPEHSPEDANSKLDALLQKGIQADKRATKPPLPVYAPPMPVRAVPSGPQRRLSAPIETLDRLSIRFTKQEAEMLEKARGVARALGYKISDSAVFRLALNAFRPDSLTPEILERILAGDGRRRQN